MIIFEVCCVLALLVLLVMFIHERDESWCNDPVEDEENDRDQTISGLLAKAEAAGINVEDLDEVVHELASSIAADVNNSGMEGQLAYLVGHLGLQFRTATRTTRYRRAGHRYFGGAGHNSIHRTSGTS